MICRNEISLLMSDIASLSLDGTLSQKSRSEKTRGLDLTCLRSTGNLEPCGLLPGYGETDGKYNNFWALYAIFKQR